MSFYQFCRKGNAGMEHKVKPVEEKSAEKGKLERKNSE